MAGVQSHRQARKGKKKPTGDALVPREAHRLLAMYPEEPRSLGSRKGREGRKADRGGDNKARCVS